MFDKNILAKNIKKYRKQQNISQNDLAKALFISPQAVSKWESAVTIPDIENIYNVSKILEVSIDTLLRDSSLPKAMICVDGGGSKTEFLLFTQDGQIKDRLVLGSSNPNVTSINESFSVFKKGIDTIKNNCYQLAGIYIGAAGMRSGINGEIILKKLKQEYGNIPIDVKSDIFNVIASTSCEGNCIALICGTGAVVYANTDKGMKRFGGWGYKLDTKGSGYDIGREALRTALTERECLKNPCIITTLIEEKLKSGVWDLIHEIYEREESYIASFAPIVFKSYELGDKTAENILKENACRLAELITKADELYDCGNTVIASGSIISKNKVYADMVESYLPKGKKLIIPKLPQIYGAARLCLKLCSAHSSANSNVFTDNFKKQYEKILNER